MRFFTASAAVLLLFSTVLPSQASRIKRGPTAKHKKVAATQHQRAMDDTRATQIQTALVKAGYLKEASGHWDSESQAAMQKLQGDNGWQTKLVPDSRALIKLGLGPNAQAAMPTMTSVAGATADNSAATTEAAGDQ